MNETDTEYYKSAHPIDTAYQSIREKVKISDYKIQFIVMKKFSNLCYFSYTYIYIYRN